MHKKNTSRSGIVYSTDKSLSFNKSDEPEIAIKPENLRLTVKLDKRNRGGKLVTVIDGFLGSAIEQAGKEMKIFCGTGGSVKDGQIIIQGDNRDKVMQWLAKHGYPNARKT